MDKIPVITSILEFLSAIFPFFKKEKDTKQIIQQNTEGDNIHADNIQINHDYSTNIHYQNSFYPDIDEDYEIKRNNDQETRKWKIVFFCLPVLAICVYFTFKEYSHFKYTMLLFKWHKPAPRILELSLTGTLPIQLFTTFLLALKKIRESYSYKRAFCIIFYSLLILGTGYILYLNLTSKSISTTTDIGLLILPLFSNIALIILEAYVLFETEYTKPDFRYTKEKMERLGFYLGLLFFYSITIGIECYIH